jgi:hypothetical protein
MHATSFYALAFALTVGLVAAAPTPEPDSCLKICHEVGGGMDCYKSCFAKRSEPRSPMPCWELCQAYAGGEDCPISC